MSQLETLLQFFEDKAKSQNNFLTEGMIRATFELWNKHKKEVVETGDTIICVDLGKFGNIEIRRVDVLERPATLQYREGYYDYVSIRTNFDKTILFTDYSTTEPYNRQSPFYVGYSFSNLELVKDTGEWRQFEITRPSNISFAVWGFSYNKYWDKIDFGICLKSESVDEFVAKLLKIFQK